MAAFCLGFEMGDFAPWRILVPHDEVGKRVSSWGGISWERLGRGGAEVWLVPYAR